MTGFASPDEVITSTLLHSAGAANGFFGRPASNQFDGAPTESAVYSLPVGADTFPETTQANRSRIAATLGMSAGQLYTVRQVHGDRIVVIDETSQSPTTVAKLEADGLVTRRRDVALGVLAADCMPFLMIDPNAGVIGAFHAGWRGALAGVLEAGVDAMVRLGASPRSICASLGPCLRQKNFETGFDLIDQFLAKDQDTARFFADAERENKRMFDLAGFARARLAAVGVDKIYDLGICTMDENARFYSYRVARQSGAPDDGRNVAIISFAE